MAPVLVAAGAGAATLAARGSAHRDAAGRPIALGTAVVRRGDLAETRRFHGQLGYPARGSAHLSGPGTVTSLPHVGELLGDGSVIAGVDDRPIGVLFGESPLYRRLGARNAAGAQLAVSGARADLLTAQATLSQATRSTGDGVAASPARAARIAQAQVGVEQARRRVLSAQGARARARAPQTGPDVALVAGNMTALGYGRGFTSTWDPALQDAVARWQARIGADPNGDLGPADAVVVPGAARVSGVQGQPGDAAAAVSIALSSPSRMATFRIRGGAPAAVARGRRVRLSTGGHTTTGHVVGVRMSRRSTVVQVAVSRSSVLARSASTRVTMAITTVDRRDVLTVPTQALLALASGGYALQLPGGRLIAVHTGVVQGTMIEVSGAEVRAGLRVVSVS